MLIAAVVSIAGAASGCGGSGGTVTVQQTTTAQVQATAVHIYAPYGPDGAPSVSISHTVTGECFAASLSTVRSEAWRCMVVNEIRDPCFSAGQVAAYVLCPEGGPWSDKVLRINLSHRLPNVTVTSEPAPTAEPAWAVELADGGRCRLITGATSMVAGLRENYDCTNGVILYGRATRSTQAWTIFGRHGTTGQLTPQVVAAMWY